jgi:hypothetical protein
MVAATALLLAVAAAPASAAALPSTPTGLTATPNNASISLSWNANPAAEAVLHYSVYRDDQTFAGPWATVTGTSFTNASDVVNGAQYCYQISATNSAGEGAKTSPVCATPTAPPTGVPSTPVGLTATAGNGSVVLSWHANPAGDAVTFYNVYRTDQQFSGPWASVAGTTHTDAIDLVNGTLYCYEVTANNAVGESAKTAPACATPTAPPVPPTPPPTPPTPPPPPPVPTITGQPAVTSTQTTATFAFTDGQVGVGFTCSLDGGAFSDCISPRLYDHLGSGHHTFLVHAVDSFGQASGNASYSWTVSGVVKGVSTKRVMTLSNIGDWVSAAVIDQFYSGHRGTELTAFRVSHCAKDRSGRFRCDVSWKRAPYAFAGTVTVGGLNPSTGHFRSGFTLIRRNTLTGGKKRVERTY